jgi:hypothetical protein
MLFGEGRANTQDQPGSGFGIYLFDFAAAGIEVGSPPELGEAGAGGTPVPGDLGEPGAMKRKSGLAESGHSNRPERPDFDSR